MKVELHTTNGKIAEVTMRRGRASPSKKAARLLDPLTVVEPNTLAVLTYDDGERYLRALPSNLNGTRLWAVLIDDPPVAA